MKKGIILFLVLVFQSAFAQLDDQKYLLEYKKGVQLFANNQFAEAQTKFSSLATRNYDNPVVPYAYFYNALSAKEKGNLYQSRVLFRQLFERFYDWDKIDDARIIYTELNFAENYYEEALKNLEIIQDPSFDGLKNEMLKKYIPKLRTISNLKDLYNKFPTQKIIAQELVSKIQSNKYNLKEDLELSDLLTNRFGLKDKKTGKEADANKETYKSHTLKFAILLPFELSAEQALITENQYVYDLYAGIQIAKDELKRKEIPVEVYAFDVKKSKSDFINIEKSGNLKGMDVFVGPLYPNPNDEATGFITTHNIVQVHPLSNNLSLISESKNIFLTQPSYTQQTKKTLEYIELRNIEKSVSIYYGASRKDSVFAGTYRREALKLGYKINAFKQFTGNYTKLFNEKGHVFFTGDELGAKLIRILKGQNIDCEVIMSATSFNWTNLNPNIFTENISLIYPEFIDQEKNTVANFNKTYFEKFGSAPSYYSCVGHDILLYFSKMLKDGKEIFKLNMEAGAYTDDYLLGGFDYSHRKNENEIVPIVKYNGSIFTEQHR